MKHLFLFFVSLYGHFSVSAQTSPFYSGIYVKLNTSGLSVTSTSETWRASEQSVPQWSAGAGLFYTSPDWRKFCIEGQAGFESTGSSQILYYNSGQGQVTRIYDRYRIVPVSLLIRRSLTENNSFYLSAGMKTGFVLSYTSRHTNVAAPPSGTIILNPEVKKVFHNVIVEFGWVRPHGDIVLTVWHAFTPLINDAKVIAMPLGAALTIKADIF